MRRYHRYGSRLARGKNPFGGAIWLIGLAIMFLTGFWWPGILILIGLSILVAAIWKENAGETIPDAGFDTQPVQPFSNPPPVIPTPLVITPAANTPRYDLLPSNCPRCGAPVRSNEVKWAGTHPTCAYCGSTFLLRKG
jgi:hypothetical protein